MKTCTHHCPLVGFLLLVLGLTQSGCHAFVVRQGMREPGAAPTYAAGRPRIAPSSLPLPTTTTTTTRSKPALSMATTEETTDISTMRIGEIKQELESYGISTKSFLEKSELVEALTKARADGLTPKSKPETPKSTTTESSSSSKTTEPEDNRPREEWLQEEMEACQSMKNSELKQELTERGISTGSFLEKAEFVKALAEARVDGVTKTTTSGSSSGEEGYAEYADVEVLTSEDAGPRPKGQQQQQQQQQSPFGGAAGGNPFGGAGGMGGMADMMGGMGGMGGIADMLKNMGGGGAGGVNPFAGGAGAAGMET